MQQTPKDEVENVLLQNIDQSIFDELNNDLTITNITPISICYPKNSTNVTPGQKRKKKADKEPTETDELRDVDRPLVVIEDEHGFKSMYWYLEPTSEDNESIYRKRQSPARYMASFWLLVTNKAKQNEEQDNYRSRGGGTREEIAEIRHTQNITQAGLALDKA